MRNPFPLRIAARVPITAFLLVAMPSIAASQAPPPGAGGTDSGGLGGTSWQLVKFQSGDDKVVTPDDPLKYTAAFDTDGTVSVRFDCNQGRGTWKATGPQLELAALRLTRAACPAGSLYERLARDWAYIRSYVRKNGRLYLALKADAGIYEFAPMAAKPALKSAVKSLGPFTFRCQGPAGANENLTATFYETQPGLLLLARGGETRPAFSATAASGSKYEGNEISYWEHQGEAVVDWSGTELRCKTSPGATLGK